jgi:hypothetical protein
MLNVGDPSDEISLEKLQSLAVKGSRKHNLPFFLDEEVDIPNAA